MLLAGEHSSTDVGFQNGEPGGAIATSEPSTADFPSVSGLIADPTFSTLELPPAPPLSPLDPYFDPYSTELHQAFIAREGFRVAPTPEVIAPATLDEMRQVARLISRYFSDIPVSAVPFDEKNLERGYRLKMELFFEDPWICSREIPSIAQQLESLRGFSLIVNYGGDFYRKIESSFVVDLDSLPNTGHLPEIKQRVFEGVFAYRVGLNGPWV
jgi:hypothetical protein